MIIGRGTLSEIVKISVLAARLTVFSYVLASLFKPSVLGAGMIDDQIKNNAYTAVVSLADKGV